MSSKPTVKYVDINDLITYDQLYNHVHSRTTEEWASVPEYIGVAGDIYVYTDRQIDEGTEIKTIAGIKVSDGKAYLIDQPFVTDLIEEHVLDKICHITQEEREYWNNKVTCYIPDQDIENLVLTKENIIIN